jgi:hypothetical protein
MKKANLVLRILTMALLFFVIFIGLLAIASSHNVPAKKHIGHLEHPFYFF